MTGQNLPSSETDPEFYTWGIVFLTREGKFQCNALQSEGGRNSQGLLDFLGEEAIQLTQARRLTPYQVQFSKNSKPQDLYLFCTVRNGKLLSLKKVNLQHPMAIPKFLCRCDPRKSEASCGPTESRNFGHTKTGQRGQGSDTDWGLSRNCHLYCGILHRTSYQEPNQG